MTSSPAVTSSVSLQLQRESLDFRNTTENTMLNTRFHRL